jgi:predicted ATPase
MTSQRDASFAMLLRRYRLLAGLSQEDLAERARLSLNAVGSLERGINRTPYPRTVALLADALNLDEERRAALVAAARSGLDDESSRGAPEGNQPSESSNGLAASSTLPLAPTSFVGRLVEITTIQQVLRQPDVRLLTLIGPGGVGKTRLALQAARAMFADFPDGIFFVSLAPIVDARLVILTIAQALNVRSEGARPPFEVLKLHLERLRALLIVDNFEQILPAAPVLADLLAAAPRLKVLVTSRAVLHVSGERALAVAAMAVPYPVPPASVDTVAQIGCYDAVALFAERARTAQPDFNLTQDNVQTVVGICSRLDGLPLAIELAATRIRLLSPAELLARLSQRLPLLLGGPRDAPARQQTLRDTILWSYDLLQPGEQRLFRRLSIFVGRASLAAVEAIDGSGDDSGQDTLQRLDSLVTHSLVDVKHGVSESRYGMLETIREFGLEQLEKRGEAPAVRDWHATWCLAMAGEPRRLLMSQSDAPALERLKREQDNLRAALTWVCASNNCRLAVRLAGVLVNMWWISGDYAEGRRQLTTVLTLPEVIAYPAEVAWLRQGDGWLAYLTGELAAAWSSFALALDYWRRADDRRQLATALRFLGMVALEQGDFRRAIPLLDEALVFSRETGDRQSAAVSLLLLGVVAREQGDPVRGKLLLEESLTMERDAQLATWVVAHAQHNLGLALDDLDDPAEAAALLIECLNWAVAEEQKRLIAFGLESFASLAAKVRRPVDALRLIGAVERLREEIGCPVPPVLGPRYARTLALARQQLSPEAADRAIAEGRRMTWQEASLLKNSLQLTAADVQ